MAESISEDGSLEQQIFYNLKAVQPEFIPDDFKRYYFHDDEVVTLLDIKHLYKLKRKRDCAIKNKCECKYGYEHIYCIARNNGVLCFDKDDLKIWYSQLSRIPWDKYGVLRPYILKIKDEEYDLSKISIYQFKDLVYNVPLKVVFQELCFYVYKEDEKDKDKILAYFRERKFDKIAGHYRPMKLFHFETI